METFLEQIQVPTTCNVQLFSMLFVAHNLMSSSLTTSIFTVMIVLVYLNTPLFAYIFTFCFL